MQHRYLNENLHSLSRVLADPYNYESPDYADQYHTSRRIRVRESLPPYRQPTIVDSCTRGDDDNVRVITADTIDDYSGICDEAQSAQVKTSESRSSANSCRRSLQTVFSPAKNHRASMNDSSQERCFSSGKVKYSQGCRPLAEPSPNDACQIEPSYTWNRHPELYRHRPYHSELWDPTSIYYPKSHYEESQCIADSSMDPSWICMREREIVFPSSTTVPRVPTHTSTKSTAVIKNLQNLTPEGSYNEDTVEYHDLVDLEGMDLEGCGPLERQYLQAKAAQKYSMKNLKLMRNSTESNTLLEHSSGVSRDFNKRKEEIFINLKLFNGEELVHIRVCDEEFILLDELKRKFFVKVPSSVLDHWMDDRDLKCHILQPAQVSYLRDIAHSLGHQLPLTDSQLQMALLRPHAFELLRCLPKKTRMGLKEMSKDTEDIGQEEKTTNVTPCKIPNISTNPATNIRKRICTSPPAAAKIRCTLEKSPSPTKCSTQELAIQFKDLSDYQIDYHISDLSVENDVQHGEVLLKDGSKLFYVKMDSRGYCLRADLRRAKYSNNPKNIFYKATASFLNRILGIGCEEIADECLDEVVDIYKRFLKRNNYPAMVYHKHRYSGIVQLRDAMKILSACSKLDKEEGESSMLDVVTLERSQIVNHTITREMQCGQYIVGSVSMFEKEVFYVEEIESGKGYCLISDLAKAMLPGYPRFHKASKVHFLLKVRGKLVYQLPLEYQTQLHNCYTKFCDRVGRSVSSMPSLSWISLSDLFSLLHSKSTTGAPQNSNASKQVSSDLHGEKSAKEKQINKKDQITGTLILRNRAGSLNFGEVNLHEFTFMYVQVGKGPGYCILSEFHRALNGDLNVFVKHQIKKNIIDLLKIAVIEIPQQYRQKIIEYWNAESYFGAQKPCQSFSKSKYMLTANDVLKILEFLPKLLYASSCKQKSDVSTKRVLQVEPKTASSTSLRDHLHTAAQGSDNCYALDDDKTKEVTGILRKTPKVNAVVKRCVNARMSLAKTIGETKNKMHRKEMPLLPREISENENRKRKPTLCGVNQSAAHGLHNTKDHVKMVNFSPDREIDLPYEILIEQTTGTLTSGKLVFKGLSFFYVENEQGGYLVRSDVAHQIYVTFCQKYENPYLEQPKSFFSNLVTKYMKKQSMNAIKCPEDAITDVYEVYYRKEISSSLRKIWCLLMPVSEAVEVIRKVMEELGLPFESLYQAQVSTSRRYIDPCADSYDTLNQPPILPNTISSATHSTSCSLTTSQDEAHLTSSHCNAEISNNNTSGSVIQTPNFERSQIFNGPPELHVDTSHFSTL